MFNDNAWVDDLNGDGQSEIVVPSDVTTLCAYRPNGVQLDAAAIYGGEKWGGVGTWESLATEVRGWGRCNGVRTESYRSNFAHGASVIADMDGDNIKEVVVTGNMYNCAVGHPPGKYTSLFIFNADRSRFKKGAWNWEQAPVNTGAPLSESYSQIENCQPNPVVVDLDGDRRKEILFASYDGKMHAYWLDKTEHYNWPYSIYTKSEGFYRFASEPVVADLDRDGCSEVIFTSWTQKTSVGMRLGKLSVFYWVLLNVLVAGIASAQIFTVNSGYDVNDLDPGNGLCVAYLFVSPPFVIPFCTLRAAIEETNALPGRDIILLGSGTFRLTLSGLSENNAVSGDLDITDSLQIIGSGVGKTFIDADGLDRVFDIREADITVSLSGVSVINGRLPSGLVYEQKGGGGLRNRGSLVLDRVMISDNMVLGAMNGDAGGGLFNQGTCTVTRSTIQGNFAHAGGGLFNGSQANLQVRESTIYGNSSRGGGGLMNEGATELVNSTLSGNSAAGGGTPFGGALWNRSRLQLVQCTIAENFANSGGGINNTETVSLINTLLSANTGGNCRSTAGFVSNEHNLDSDNSCGLTAADLKNIDPRLASLDDNGGPTRTHALNPGSPAIDGGKTVVGITTDQRGLARPQRKAFDIGAFEMVELSIAPLVMPLLLD